MEISNNKSENTSPLGIRRMDDGDIEPLSQMYTELFRNPPWNYDWLKRENILRYFEDLSRTPNFVGFVILQGGALMGGCLGTISDYFLAATYDIKEIFITQHLQNSGYGSFLLSEIERELKSAGVSCISLSTVSEIPAYPFYLKNGYAVSETSVLMSKLL